MNYRFKNYLLLAVMAILAACSGSSNEKQDTEAIVYSDEVAEIINFISSGTLRPSDPIEVIFNNAVVTEEAVKEAVENPFKFSPGIEGKATWISTYKLRFTPASHLKTRTNYTGTLDLSKILPDAKVKSVDLKFYVEGQEITNFKADLQLMSPTNPKELVYQGKVSFAQETTLEKVQKASKFGSFELNWNQENSRQFSFVSGVIKRGESATNYTFSMSYQELGLEESLEQIVTVNPLSDFKIEEISKDEEGKSPKMTIKFSDLLDPNQDLNGFITITPATTFHLQKMGKFIFLDGDFRFGQEYTVKLASGVQSKWATKTKSASEQKVKFKDISPQVEFSSDGIFMPTTNNNNLQFLTTNVKRVHVEIKKIMTNNLEDFLERESMSSSKSRSSEFNNTYVSSLGAIVYNQTLEIGEEKNKWLVHNISLNKLLDEYKNGLFLIRINFNPSDMLVKPEEDELQYIQQNGQIYKPFTISNIGLLVKRKEYDYYDIFTTDLRTGAPLPGVAIKMVKYNNRYTGTTDSNGQTTIKGDSYFYHIEAYKNDQVSFITNDDMRWNISGYDVGGLDSYDLQARAYIYTERGVYRPGDSVNVSCIVRHHGKGEDDMPAHFTVFNPEGTLVHEQTIKGAKDSFYNFAFGTSQNAPTGNWSIQINTGNRYFYHDLKIETIVANRLKVNLTPEVKTVLPDKKQLKIDLESRYLFGTPAKGLVYDAEVELFDVAPNFPKYKDFQFYNQMVEFQDIQAKIISGNLNEEGKAVINWNIPNLKQAPSPLKAKIKASVQEEGGRPNDGWTYLDVHPFSQYVGLKNDYYYTKLNEEIDIPVIMVDTKGDAVSGKELVYRIYRNEKYWWYQYDSYRDFKLRYKTDEHSYLVEEGVLTSSKNMSIPFRPVQSGNYLIEVQDASTPYGHVSSIFTSAYPYGGIPSGDENSGTLALRSDKDAYTVGEEAEISFPSPKQGNILLTVEQGEKIIIKQWITPAKTDDMKVKVKISKSMSPNAYVTVTVLQNHDQTVNDRPIRMFGILPIKVLDPDTRQEIVINMPEELEPKQHFDIDISTLNGAPTQFTVAVVDEGLLDLTGFRTPDPWKSFYQKIALDVQTWDLFGHVIGANAGDVFKTFSIGGDLDYRESQTDPFERKKRFKPVCLFQGPISTDSNGKANVSFDMPNYVGSVRVMVIAASGSTYGSAEKTVPVRSDLIIQPTIPRALKPGDEFTIPVNVFATKENLGPVDIKITTEGPLEIIGTNSAKHTFTKTDDAIFYFKVKVKEAIGQSKIIITGVGNKTKSVYDADVPVNPGAARIYQSSEQIIKPGESLSINLPKTGIDGTNNARLKLAVFPNMDFQHRLGYLIQYPYGCIEQTTSSVFPQLKLKTLYQPNSREAREIDQNINAGIDRLRMFQLSNGGFSYWPGGEEASDWGSNYAGQFLIEARKLGYVVPDLMYDGVIRYLERETRVGPKEKEYLTTRVYRCFVLALAGQAPVSEMNLLKQNNYKEMNNVQKWMLVASYSLAGAQDKVQDLVGQIATTAENYIEFSHTYGSTNRDLGIILRCLVVMDRKDDAALMAKQLAKTLSSYNWYSTQTLGQMLLGLGSYFEYAGIGGGGEVILKGTVELPGGKKVTIESVNDYELYINEGYGQALKLTINSDVNVSQLYATLSSNGVPLRDTSPAASKNLSMEVTWYDESGSTINIDEVKQGSTFYGRFRVLNTSVVSYIEEVALMQMLPSGWEIENTRLNNDMRPTWMNSWNLDQEEYLDIRDDRVMWFFDLNKSKYDFVVKINAITAGTYTLPGAICEAMYNNDYRTNQATKTVKVVK